MSANHQADLQQRTPEERQNSATIEAFRSDKATHFKVSLNAPRLFEDDLIELARILGERGEIKLETNDYTFRDPLSAYAVDASKVFPLAFRWLPPLGGMVVIMENGIAISIPKTGDDRDEATFKKASAFLRSRQRSVIRAAALDSPKLAAFNLASWTLCVGLAIYHASTGQWRYIIGDALALFIFVFEAVVFAHPPKEMNSELSSGRRRKSER